ncbi:MAG: transposase, partial [Lachnospiraceae bacterium]|nr:transposase [Lachnospiraceae bacterium]
MKTRTQRYSNTKQAVLPMLISDYLDICDPVLTFDRFMGEIELEKYLKSIPRHYTGRIRYNPVSMLKTVLFGFMTNGYISLRELEDQCKVNLRFMYLMEHETPSYRTFGYFKSRTTSPAGGLMLALRGQNVTVPPEGGLVKPSPDTI